MSNKYYQYTLLRQDGTSQDLGIRREMPLEAIYFLLKCETIQEVPKSYLKGNKRVTVYVDENGRYKEGNKRNPHFEVLTDENGVEWDVVGDALVEAPEPKDPDMIEVSVSDKGKEVLAGEFTDGLIVLRRPRENLQSYMFGSEYFTPTFLFLVFQLFYKDDKEPGRNFLKMCEEWLETGEIDDLLQNDKKPS